MSKVTRIILLVTFICSVAYGAKFIDNVKVDGSTISTKVANGDLRIDPNGTGSIGIGGSPDGSAALHIVSTTQGFLAPVVTTIQRDAISAPATGLMAFNSDTSTYQLYNGSSWSDLGGNLFADNLFRVQDDGDATKEIAFQASGITTGTTRTITMPDADVDLGNFATIALDNLASVAINADVLPDGAGTRDLGNTSFDYAELYVNDIFLSDATPLIKTEDNGAGNTNPVTVTSGDATSGDSGDLILTTGTATGTRGSLRLDDGSAAPGYILTSTASDGTAQWQPNTGGAGAKNILDNPTFDQGIANWTASGGTFAHETSGSNLLVGDGSASWNSDASSQTLSSDAVTIEDGFFGRNGVGYCRILASGGTATHTLEVYDGTNVIASQAITPNADPLLNYVHFIFPSSGTLSLRLQSTASNEPIIIIDDCFLGENNFITEVSQAELVVSAYKDGVASCQWQRTGTSLGAFGTDTDCAGITVETEGSVCSVTTTDDDLPQVVLTNCPPGNYKVLASFGGNYTSASNDISFAISDGTTTTGTNHFVGDGTGLWNVNLSGNFNYTTGGSHTFQIYGAAAAGDSAITNTTASVNRLSFQVYKFPLAQDKIFTPDIVNWRVDATVAGANPSLGTSAVSTYTGIEDAGLSITKNDGSLDVEIPCSSTNASTGTTCSSGNESVGVVFDMPRAGAVRACANFQWAVNATSGGSAGATFQIVETPNNAQTISQEGKGKINAFYSGVTSSLATTFPFMVCGTFDFDSSGQKTLRLMYEQSIGGSISSSDLRLDESTSNGQRDLHWEIYPIDQQIPMPAIVNSVVNSNNDVTRIETAYLNCDASSSIISQRGSWVSSVGNIASGICTVTLDSGIFSSSDFYCNVSQTLSAVGGLIISSADPSSATSFTIQGSIGATGALATSFDTTVTCIGSN